jgi:hypothetical protein
MQVLLKHLHSEPAPIEQASGVRVPVPLHRFIWRCLAKDRAHRPANAAEFLVLLKEAALASERSETEDLLPMFTTGEGFRVTEEALEAITTKKKLERPLTSESEPGGLRQASDIIIEAPRSPLPWLVAAAMVLVAMMAVGFVVFRERRAPAPASAEAAAGKPVPVPEVAVDKPSAPIPPPIAETVAVTIVSEPPGAEVVLDGKKAGVAPWMGRVPKTTSPVKVVLTLAGHEPKAFDLVPDRDRLERLALAPVPPAPVAKPEPPVEMKAVDNPPPRPPSRPPAPKKSPRNAEEYLP